MNNSSEKEIEMLYRENVQRTAPDLDKLWSRIEQRIDEADKTDTAETSRPEIVQTKRIKKNSIGRIAALAAVFALVVGVGAVYLNASKDEKLKTDNNDNNASFSAVAGDQTADGEAAGDTADDVKQEDNMTEAAEFNEAVNTPKGEINGGDQAAELRRPDAEAEQAADDLNNEPEPLPETADEAVYLSEDLILRSTEYFADVRVISADADSFTAEVLNCWSKNGSTLSGTVTAAQGSVQVEEGQEYLIPFAGEPGSLSLTLRSAPQIEFTGDGRIIFCDLWESLTAGSEPYAYPAGADIAGFAGRMLTAPEDNIEALISKWQEQ